MFNSKYVEEGYLIKPLGVNADLSETSLEQALILLGFKLGDDRKYTLVLGRYYLNDIVKIAGGYNLFNIQIELQEDLLDGWYIVDVSNKTIIYSIGA